MKFFQLVPSNTHFDFIGKFKYFMAFSLITGGAVVFGIMTKGFRYGIDFTGGTVIQVKFKTPHTAEQVRKLLDDMGEKEVSVVSSAPGDLEYMITAPVSEDKKAEPLNKRLGTITGENALSIDRVDIVGPKVGAELKGASLRALFYSIIIITIYIWLRFDFRFAPGATIAMLHDLLLCSSFYIISGREFTITAVAALLTIAGYSVNDTIVVYDRVREIIRSGGGGGAPLGKLINDAINLTLSRTLLTSTVTFISVIPLVFFTTGEIQSFALAMCLGIFVGTYSTVYIASPFTIYVEKFQNRKKSPQGKRVATV